MAPRVMAWGKHSILFIAIGLASLAGSCGDIRKGAAAKADLQGTVMDSATKAPVQGAKVTVWSVDKPEDPPVVEAVTDQKGAFAFPVLREGQYKVVVESSSHVRYETTVAIVDTTGGEAAGVDLKILLNARGDMYPEWATYVSRGAVRAVARAKTGDLWVGSDGGLVRIRPDGGQVGYTSSEGLPANRVYALLATDVHLWVGTEGGLARLAWDSEEWALFSSEKDGLAGDKIYAVDRGPDGSIWLGTDGGVSRLQGYYWTSHRKGTGTVKNACGAVELPDPEVLALAFDPEGRTWFGTANGLASLGNNAWCWYLSTWPNVGLADNRIERVRILPGASIERSVKWLATGLGVSSFDGCRWTSYGPDLVTEEYPPVSESRCSEAAFTCDPTNTNLTCTVDGAACGSDPTACVAKGGECKGICTLLKPTCDLGRATCVTPSATCTLPAKGCTADGSVCTDETACQQKGGQCIQLKMRCEGQVANCVLPALVCPGPGCDQAEAKCETAGAVCTLPQRACVLAANSCEGQGVCALPARQCVFPQERPCPLVSIKVSADQMPDGRFFTVWADTDGTVWAGTRSGLLRFSNNQWSWLKSEVPQVPVSMITREGNDLWVGIDGGLKKYDGSNWTDQALPPGPIGPDIRDLVHTDAGTWLATDRGVSFFKTDGTWTHYTTAQGLPSDNVRAIERTPGGEVWAGTPTGLAKLVNDKFEALCAAEKSARDTCITNCQAGDPSKVCTGTCSTQETAYQTCSAPYQDVRALEPGSGNALWIGTSKGLLLRDGSNVTSYTGSTGLRGNLVTALYVESDGALWVATAVSRDPTSTACPKPDPKTGCQFTGGLNRIKGSEILSYTGSNGPLGKIVYAIARGPKGRLWVGTDQGLSIYDGNAWSHYGQNTTKPAEGPGGKRVYAIAVTDREEVWLGTDAGASRGTEPGGPWEHLTSTKGLADNKVVVARTRSGNEIWLGTPKGVSVYQPRQ